MPFHPWNASLWKTALSFHGTFHRSSVGYDPQLTQQIQAVPAERQQTKTGPGLRSFSDRSVPLAPLESGTVERSRARTLTEAATAGRSFPATRWRAAPERRAGMRQRKRASKDLISGLRALTFAIRTCSPRCPFVPMRDAPRPWVLPVAFDQANGATGLNSNAVKPLDQRVWRSGVPLADAWRNAKFARCIDRRPTKDRGWGAGGGKTAASSCWSGVFCFSRPFPKNLDRGLAT